MDHKQKQKIARRGITSREIQKKVSIFDSKFWNGRKESIAKRIKNKLNKRNILNSNDRQGSEVAIYKPPK
jgi:hypothetical protein